MRSPWRGMKQLHLLRHDQPTELAGETDDEIRVRVHAFPVRPPIGVVVELPKMHKLVDRPGIALEIADQLLVMPTLLQRREAEFLIQLHRFGHLPHIERVGPQFVQSHGWNPPCPYSTNPASLSLGA